MSVAANCLTAAQIQSLLGDSLEESEVALFTAHLGKCTGCQDALQRTATGEMAVEEWIAEPSSLTPPSDSAYWPAMNSLTEAMHEGTLAGNEPTPLPSGTPLLSFLKPSADPAYLGRLDHFEIARVIGRGGMGIVLEGFDTSLQRQVAIKVLNPEYAKNDTARKRFCREGRAAASISHEHVVSMYQVAKESEEQVAYLVMQLIEGETLEKRLADSAPLPAQDVARLGMQIAAGLSAAHARGLVHRDIKPANVLLEQGSDRVKLTDFGVARAADDVKLTKTGMVTGTPLYMSPEQAMSSTTDEKSDLFSFGAVLYEMATGLSPFQSPSLVGVMKRVIDETPAPPHRVNPAIPRKLSDVIMALLEKKPGNRPESAASVALALAGIVSE
ncbi:MAG: serine/threonine protein kinase, partial [Planctomycetales bacterium]|nr:serine/threonine protein kinase [Planctomycetales bacterium]